MRPNAIIYLDRLDHNLQLIRSLAGSEKKIMAVVKNEAYGHGMIPVARHLSDQVEGFCVARIEEGIRLRKEGITNPVLVFEVPQPDRAADYTAFDLTAVISDLSHFEILKKGTRCHLQFDTGMMRLGIRPEDAGKALKLYKKYEDQLRINGIFTHFANADQPDNPMTAQQISSFQEVRALFPEALFTHISNSAGLMYHREEKGSLFDGLRPGISLYGYAPGEQSIAGLKPVMEIRSQLVQVKAVNKGEKVGYGSTWVSPGDGLLGIVPMGYAHGIPRVLSNKIQVKIGENYYPQVGTISMDYLMIDLKKNRLEAGDEVQILGNPPISAKEWASASGTISYEIISRIASFTERIYR